MKKKATTFSVNRGVSLVELFQKKGLFTVTFILLLIGVVYAVFGDTETLSVNLDNKFEGIVGFLASIIFYQVPGIKMPLIVLWLFLGAIFFTFRFGLINIRGLKHSVDVIRGKFDNPKDKGEITHFQALTSALSATVGLGNIAGVAVAIGVGGPGALFWMWLTALFGMSSKFVSCTLAQIYREVDPKTGHTSGGPMYYLYKGMQDVHPNLKGFGKVLSVLFAFLCIGGAFGGGNMFQGNQTFEAMSSTFPVLKDYALPFGLGLAFLVGLVIIGGIKRIGETTSKLIPLMAVIYVAACLFIIFTNIEKLPWVFEQVFSQAFAPAAIFGGFIGVFIQGVKRAAFSNEAGIGSASIAHACAKTEEPVREGIVAMIGPFIDTIVICTMTALVVIISGVYQMPEFAGQGVAMTSAAFSKTISWFPYVLAVTVFFFAFSTMISWSYYGEKATEYLFGEAVVPTYRLIYVGFVFMGPMLKLKNVIDFSDLMILGMAFPNILGVIFLSKKAKVLLDDYWDRYKSGKIRAYK